MRRLSAREKRLALVLAAVIVAVILLQKFVIPTQRELKKTNQLLREHTQVIGQAQALSARMYQLDKDLEVLAARRQALMVPGEVTSEMIKLVGQAARLADISQLDIRPLTSEAQEGYTRYRMQLEFQASFLRLKNFLYYLEEAGCPLIIDRVEANTGKDNTDVVRANVIVSGYGVSTESETGGEK